MLTSALRDGRARERPCSHTRPHRACPHCCTRPQPNSTDGARASHRQCPCAVAAACRPLHPAHPLRPSVVSNRQVCSSGASSATLTTCDQQTAKTCTDTAAHTSFAQHSAKTCTDTAAHTILDHQCAAKTCTFAAGASSREEGRQTRSASQAPGMPSLCTTWHTLINFRAL